MNKITKILAGALLAVIAMSASVDAAYVQAGTLKQGSRGSQVLSLQQALNMSSCKVALSGAGSMGMETSYFGPATKAAVKCYQTSMGLTSDGVVGPMTGAKIAMITGTPSNLPQGCTSTAGYSPINGAACNGNGTGPVQTGAVTVALSQDNPAASNIVNNQATADLMHVTFSGSGTVTSVMLKRSGLSSQNTFDNVYLYDGATRLSDGYSFNSNGDLTINGLSIAVNGSKTISVKADASSTAAQDSTVAIALTSFTANGVTNVVNIMGNTFALATASNLATVTFNGSNSVTAATVNSGISGYALFRQSVQVNQRTVWLKAANFRVTGSAPANTLTNVKLYVDGIDTMKTASMMMMNGSNYISFDLMSSPLALTTGSHTVEVRSDVTGGSSYTLQVGLQQASDLMIQDPQYGVNISVSSFSPSNGGVITINPGSATVVQDPTFSAITKVTGGASNVAIAKFKVRGYGEDVRVNSLQVTPVISGTTPGAAGLDDVTLYFNGSQVGTQQDWTSGNLTFNLGSQLIIPANVDSTLEVRANVRTTAGANYTAGTVKADLVAGTNNAEGRTSRTTINFPAAGVTGNTLTIQTGLLVVSKNTAYANQTQNINTSGVKIGSFTLQNQSSSESVRVTSFQVGLTNDGSTVLTGGTTPTLTNFSGLRTSENTNYSVQPQAANTFSVDFTLAPGAVRTIDIFADTSSGTGNIVTTFAVTSIGVSSNVSATSSTVIGQTVTLGAGTVTNPPTLVTASTTTSQYIAAGDPMNTGTGATEATKATFNLVSTGGASTITELRFALTGTTNAVSGVKVCTQASTPVCTATGPVTGSGPYVVNLQGLNFMVPNGGSGLNLDAYVSYSPVGTTGIAPGSTSTISLSYVEYTSGGTTANFSPSIAAPTVTLVGSKPTLAVSTAQNTGLSISAESKIGEVTISADAKGNIKINDIVFTVSSSGFSTAPTAIASPRIADGTTTINGSACTPTSLSVLCEFGTTGNTDYDGYALSAGQSKTFSLFGTLTGALATGSGTPIVSSSVSQSGFNWDDTSTNGASGKNLSGALIYNFPTNSYSVRQ